MNHLIDKIYKAANLISAHVRKTPLVFDHEMAIWIKWESDQITGAFKLRGALSKILNLTMQERVLGVVAASAGNHGIGVAYAAKLIGINAIIFLPSGAPKKKENAIRSLGATVKVVSGGYEEAEAEALEFSKAAQSCWVSPYNDIDIIAGQGTIGIEIASQLGNRTTDALTVLVPVSGGGLISGIGTFLKTNYPNVSIIGVQPETNAFMHAIYHGGEQDSVKEFTTLADGLAGRIQDNSITIPIVKNVVDEIVLVSETEIASAIRWAYSRYGKIVEGAGAVGLAALLFGKVERTNCLVIVSGSNIDRPCWERLI